MEFEFMTADTVLPPCMPLPTAMLRLPVSSTAKVMYARLLDATLAGGAEDTNGILFVRFPIVGLAEALSRSSVTVKRYLDHYTGSAVCSKQLFKEALNHPFDEPKQWEIREVNDIMNHCITGWKYFSNPRIFEGYGRQKGWEREAPATGADNGREKTPDGFVEVTEQMELPF